MVKVKVSKQIFDDEVYIRSEKLKINNKSIQTPMKSFTLNDLRKDVKLNDEIKKVNEVFKKFSKESLQDYVSGKKDITKVHKKINTDFKKISSDELNFCFTYLDYTKFPEGKEIDMLTNVSYIYSDATPLPLVHNLFKPNQDAEKSYDKFTDFMVECIDSINRLNNKPIIGIIPSSMPPSYIESLINFYHDNDITSFAFDFENKTHVGLTDHLREMMISIIELDILNESFTYSCNTQRGKASRGSDITKANDILVYNFGFDIVGDSHMAMKMPPDAAKRLKNRNPTSIRLFNNDDYGHYRYDNVSLIEDFYPHEKTEIPIEFFNPEGNIARSRNCQKLFNNEMFGLELQKYNRLLKENESALDYLKTKNQIKDDLINFTQFRSYINL